MVGGAFARLPRVRAVVLNSFAGIDGLELSEVPDPTPADGEELVHVRAASLGPWDIAGANGAFVAAGGSSELPQVQGWDFAGETADGARVVGFVPQPWMGIGTFAEQISVPAAILTPVPEPLGFPEASALPVCGLTARLLVDAAAVHDGDVVLVTGAAGMVGGFVAELATSRGARVVAGVRNADIEEAGQLGAEMAFDTAGGLADRFGASGRKESMPASIRSVSAPTAWPASATAARSSPPCRPRYPMRRGGYLPRRCRCNPTPPASASSRIVSSPAS